MTHCLKVKTKSNKNGQINGQQGQTFIEFLFLLVLVMSLSFGFLNIANSNLGNVWEATVNKILDPYGTGEVERVELR